MTGRTDENDLTLPPGVRRVQRALESLKTWPDAYSTGHRTRMEYYSLSGLLQHLHLLLMYWSDAAMGESGPSVRSIFHNSFFSFLCDAFSQSSPNFDKTKITTNWDRYGRALSNPQFFQNNLPLALIHFRKNKQQKRWGATCGHPIGFITNRSFKCSPYLWTNTSDAKKNNQKETTKQHTCVYNAILERKTSCSSSLIQS